MVYNWRFFKHSCLLCDEPAPPSGFCAPCAAELPWLGPHCWRCAIPLPAPGLICGQCQRHPPHFDQVIAPWRFDFPLDALIHRFKHRADWPAGRLLAGQLAAHLQQRFAVDLPRPELLLPVPLARRRLRERGYNQAQMLGQWLGQCLALPVQTELLSRARETPSQQGLDAAQRRRNLRQAFALAERPLPMHVAVIDDVLTTGATAEAIARLLKRAGVARVDLYCLARTPKPGA